MKRSSDRILTSHCGSLPRPRELLVPLHAKDSGDARGTDDLAQRVRASVAQVVRKQADLAIDVVNDGEHSKSSFAHYARTRIGGLERTNEQLRYRASPTRDALAFPGVYDEMRVMFDARTQKTGRPRSMTSMICTGPIKYIGHAELKADIENLKRALDGVDVEETFMTAISSTNLEMYFPNEYYRSDEEYLTALADAMNEEYRAIVDAGFLLQIDDPRLITHYNRTPGLTHEENRKFMALRVEMVNHVAARHSRGARALPHLLQRERWAARARPRARALRRPHAQDPGAGLFDRGLESAARARMEGLGRGQAAGRQDLSFRAWCRTACIRWSIRNWSPSASSASPKSSDERT